MTPVLIPRLRRVACRDTAIAFALLALGSTGLARADDIIQVQIDQAKIVQLPDNTKTVIIGNPIVADVTLLKGNSKMVLTGKGFGETNFIALDKDGNSLGESTIQVRSAFRGLIVQRGLDRESYSCAPRCQPTVNLGDTSKFMGEAAGDIQAHTSLSSGGPGAGK